MKFFLISDYLSDEILGGCEINNDELSSLLRKREHPVVEKKSAFVDSKFIADHRHHGFIVSNFIELSPEAIHELMKCRYVLYEHDHKYLVSRNPAQYEDFRAPKDAVINLDFYRNAAAVFCQSGFHMDIVQMNTGLTNLINVSGNLWSEDSLDLMEKIAAQPKLPRVSILNSPIPHKNTRDAIKYCQFKERNYDLISSRDPNAFLSKLGKNEEFVFFPQTPETLSRVACEARMMNMTVTTNNMVGATKEPWFSSKGKELIARMRSQRTTITDMVERIFI